MSFTLIWHMLNKVYVLLVNQRVNLYLFIKYSNLLQQCGYNSYWSESSGREEKFFLQHFWVNYSCNCCYERVSGLCRNPLKPIIVFTACFNVQDLSHAINTVQTCKSTLSSSYVRKCFKVVLKRSGYTRAIPPI